MKYNFVIWLLLCCVTLFGQEKIIDTVDCPITDGLYRYYVGNLKESYLEGKIKRCNKDGTWYFFSNNTVRLLLEFKDGICFIEKSKSTILNSFLLIAKLSDSRDTLELYDYDSQDLIQTKRIYLIDKMNIPKNSSLTSENVNFVKKLIYEMNIDYTPFICDITITSIREIDESKNIITKYFKNYLSNQKTLLYEIDSNNSFIFGDKNSYYRLRKKELKCLKKSMH